MGGGCGSCIRHNRGWVLMEVMKGGGGVLMEAMKGGGGGGVVELVVVVK